MRKRNYLSCLATDPVLKTLIDIHGELDIDGQSRDIFTDIVRQIIGQQLSGKAADTIEGRFKKLLKKTNPFSPSEILKLDSEVIRAAGLSYSKIKYIKGLAHAVIEKDLDLTTIEKLSDEDVIVHLTKIKGIGRWTAEMTIMFTLRRPDVFSLGDAGLRNAIHKLYGIATDDLDRISALSMTWKPYRTFASRYLWKSLD